MSGPCAAPVKAFQAVSGPETPGNPAQPLERMKMVSRTLARTLMIAIEAIGM